MEAVRVKTPYDLNPGLNGDVGSKYLGGVRFAYTLHFTDKEREEKGVPWNGGVVTSKVNIGKFILMC